MAFKLKKGRLSGRAVRRICREQIDGALSVIAAGDVTPEGVHECRKVVKRLRAIFRLVEPGLERKTFKFCNRGIGQIGDLLADVRDRHVLQVTVAKLETRLAAEKALVVAPLKAHVEKRGSEKPAEVNSQLAGQLKERLEEERRRIDEIRLGPKGFAAFAPGLRKTYAGVRKNLKRARLDQTDENLHELRKAVQWHWRQIALFAGCWPAYFNFYIAACRQIAEALGDDHDLYVLKGELRAIAGLETSQIRALEALIGHRQSELRDEAMPLCARVFAEKPSAFVRRVESYWRAKGTATTVAADPIVATHPDNPGASRKTLAVPRLVAKDHLERQSHPVQ